MFSYCCTISSGYSCLALLSENRSTCFNWFDCYCTVIAHPRYKNSYFYVTIIWAYWDISYNLAFLMRTFSKLRLQTAERQDSRIRLMKEIIACVKLIKMHCWEYSFADKIAQARKSEMGLIR